MKYLFFILSMGTLVACNSASKEQPLENLDKKSAREVTLMTVSKGDSVLHITKQNIWFNGEQIATKMDTIITAKSPKTWNATDSNSNLSKVPIYVTVQ